MFTNLDSIQLRKTSNFTSRKVFQLLVEIRVMTARSSTCLYLSPGHRFSTFWSLGLLTMNFVQVEWGTHRRLLGIVFECIYIIFCYDRSRRWFFREIYFAFAVIIVKIVWDLDPWLLVLTSWSIFWEISYFWWFWVRFQYLGSLGLMIQRHWQHHLVLIVDLIIPIAAYSYFWLWITKIRIRHK